MVYGVRMYINFIKIKQRTPGWSIILLQTNTKSWVIKVFTMVTLIYIFGIFSPSFGFISYRRRFSREDTNFEIIFIYQ